METKLVRVTNRTLLIFVVVLASLALVFLVSLGFVPQGSRTTHQILSSPLVKTRLNLVISHLRHADEQTKQSIDRHLTNFQGVFAESRANALEFAETALGFGSKWRLVVDFLPGTAGGRNKRYLREAFERLVINPKTLDAAVDRLVSSLESDIRSIENQMLVKLAADLADFPLTADVYQIETGQLELRFQKALQIASDRNHRDAGALVAREILAAIIGTVVGKVVARLAVSGSIIGMGIVGGPETLGISVLSAIVADVVFSWVWDWWTDSSGRLSREIIEQLDHLENMIVNGGSDFPGIKTKLVELGNQRDSLRRAAILDILHELGDSP
jgi:hypothetical protein